MSFPSTLILVYLAAELAHQFIRLRWGGRWQASRRFVLWTLRPWAGWAVINLVIRNFPLEWRFNDPLTFPFYADLWKKDLSFPWLWEWLREPGMWMWGCVVLCIGALLILRLRDLLARASMTRGQVAASLAGLYVLSLGLTLSIDALPLGALTDSTKDGSLLRSWYNSGATMVYDIRNIITPRAYLREFTHIQAHDLKMHAVSHPPGASLALYGIGRLFSLGGKPSMYHYAIGLVVLATLNLFLLFAIGRHVTGRLAGGWLAAGLWALSPSAITYNMFAMESFYVLFYNAALLAMLRLAARPHERLPPPETIVLGVLFSIIAMLNYSWCLLTTVFTLFMFYAARSRQVQTVDAARRWFVALALFAVLWFGFLAFYHVDYIHAYLFARRFVARCYRFHFLAQSVIALVGGQWILYLMMGPVTCCAFVAALAERARSRKVDAPLALYLCILPICMAAIVMISALKVEAPRQWNWVTTLPIAFACRYILDARNPRQLAAAAMAGSFVSAIAMRLFMVFWA